MSALVCWVICTSFIAYYTGAGEGGRNCSTTETFDIIDSFGGNVWGDSASKFYQPFLTRVFKSLHSSLFPQYPLMWICKLYTSRCLLFICLAFAIRWIQNAWNMNKPWSSPNRAVLARSFKCQPAHTQSRSMSMPCTTLVFLILVSVDAYQSFLECLVLTVINITWRWHRLRHLVKCVWDAFLLAKMTIVLVAKIVNFKIHCVCKL